MLTFYSRLILTTLLTFLVLSFAARAVGATQPTNPALVGFTEGCEDKPQPCWYGIVPGVTTKDEASRLAPFYGYSISELKPAFSDLGIQHGFLVSPPITTTRFFNGDILVQTLGDMVLGIYITFSSSANLQMGSLTSFFGYPEGGGEGPGMSDIFYNAQVEVLMNDPTSPNTVVIGIKLTTGIGFFYHNWQGFGPIWKFCRFIPNNITCNQH